MMFLARTVLLFTVLAMSGVMVIYLATEPANIVWLNGRG